MSKLFVLLGLFQEPGLERAGRHAGRKLAQARRFAGILSEQSVLGERGYICRRGHAPECRTARLMRGERSGSMNPQRGQRDRKELGSFDRDCRNISIGQFALSGRG